jgi:hypothetical protein
MVKHEKSEPLRRVSSAVLLKKEREYPIRALYPPYETETSP